MTISSQFAVITCAYALKRKKKGQKQQQQKHKVGISEGYLQTVVYFTAMWKKYNLEPF